MDDSSVDAIVTDPPYGVLSADWDNAETTMLAIPEMCRVAREFVAVFTQMPMLAEWHTKFIECDAHYCEHIVWVKRQLAPSCRVSRGHESILIYSVGKRKLFYKTKGPYEDVRCPGLLTDIVTVKGIDRYIKDLRAKVNGTAVTKISSTHRQQEFSRFGGCSEDRSAEFCNYSNCWSFYPPNTNNRNGEYVHQTAKPLGSIERLIEMLTKPGAVVFDPFMGSGTTGIACHNLGRKFIGCELDKGYFEIAKDRIEAAQAQERLL